MRRVNRIFAVAAICIFLFIIPILLKARPHESSRVNAASSGGLQADSDLISSSKHPSVHIPVLMYHDFVDNLNSHANVRPIDFAKQLQYLKERGYQTINDRDLTLYFEGKEKLPPKPLMITMDDGYESNYDSAYPILKKFRMKATIFVIVSYVGKTPGYSKHFGWKQAKEMYDSGLIDIEDHTFNLHEDIPSKSRGLFFWRAKTRMVPALTNKMTINGKLETEAAYEKRVHDDLLLAKNLIEQHVGNHVDSIAYPYGVTNKTVMKIAAQIGLRYGFVINNKVANISSHDLLIDRINVDDTESGAQIDKEIFGGMLAVAKSPSGKSALLKKVS